jgi:hypothetical protein
MTSCKVLLFWKVPGEPPEARAGEADPPPDRANTTIAPEDRYFTSRISATDSLIFF